MWLGRWLSVAMAVGAAGVDAVRGIRLRICRPILGGVLGDGVGQAAKGEGAGWLPL